MKDAVVTPLAAARARRSPPPPQHDPIGLVWGALAIGRVLNTTERKAFHLLENDQVAGARKIGGKWCLNVAVFLESFLEK